MELPDVEPVAEATFLKGSFLVNVLKPEISKTFKDYEYYVFAATVYNCIELGKLDRVYMEFNKYRKDS